MRAKVLRNWQCSGWGDCVVNLPAFLAPFRAVARARQVNDLIANRVVLAAADRAALVAMITPAITASQAASALAKSGAEKRQRAERDKCLRAAAQMNLKANRPMGPEWEPFL